LVWSKERLESKVSGKTLGVDMGYKKLVATSDGKVFGLEMKQLYDDISKCEQGSKRFKRLLSHRDGQINAILKEIDLSDVKVLVIEDLLNVKHKSKFHKKVNNKLQRWSYRKCIDYFEQVCLEKGIELVKVSPAYTSQMCSSCGHVDVESRNGEKYKCVSCGYEIDADVNASVNIYNLGEYGP